MEILSLKGKHYLGDKVYLAVGWVEPELCWLGNVHRDVAPSVCLKNVGDRLILEKPETSIL